MSEKTDYDVVVLGSGLAGSILALSLSRSGCRTLVVERRRHPRFAIGESTVPTTTLWLRKLARRYGVPEAADVAHYLGLKGRGLTAYPKSHFWFGLHEDGRPLPFGAQLAFDTLRPPVGPDVHVLRSEVDAFLVSRYSAYGVDYVDQTDLVDYGYRAGVARLRLRDADGERDVRCRLVVDASGHASFFAKRFGLRQEPPPLKTNTRTIFGHFRNVSPLDRVLAGQPRPFRNPRDGGTVHHCFRGGWIWCIPFDNGLTSVGAMLDRVEFPDNDLPAEEELRRLVARFPTVAAHLGEMQPVRPLVKTGRVQFASRSILGEGFVLTPHAAAFVDPLFSTGLLLTALFIARFVPRVEQALRDGDFSTERFRPLQPPFFQEVELIDAIVSGTIASFRDLAVFRQFWRTWVHATAVQFFATAALEDDADMTRPIAYGAGFESWRSTVEQMHRCVIDADRPAAETAGELKRIMDKLDHPFQPQRYDLSPHVPLYLHTDLDRRGVLGWLWRFYRQPEVRDAVKPSRLIPLLLEVLRMGPSRPKLAGRYWLSRWRGTDFYKWVDRVYRQDADRGHGEPTAGPHVGMQPAAGAATGSVQATSREPPSGGDEDRIQGPHRTETAHGATQEIHDRQRTVREPVR